MKRAIGLLICACITTLATSSGSAYATFGVSGRDRGITFAAKYVNGRSPHSEQEDRLARGETIKYMVVRWNANCSTTSVDQVCVPTSNPQCQKGHPDDKKNRWRAFDVFVSHDGGKTYPGYPNRPDVHATCLNTVALNTPTRPALDPREIFRQATKLIPHGRWHPQPDGQAVVNKPIILTVDTDRDQTFAPFTLLGYHIELKAHIDAYTWTYGDHTPTVTVDRPGHDYAPALGGCSTTDCDAYVHHTYLHPGRYTIDLTLHWKATYRIDNEPWTRLSATIDTTSPTHTITLLNAHSELVAGN